MEIYIYDVIDSYMGVCALDVAKALKRAKDDEEVVVRINSAGGEVEEGIAIYELLRSSGKKIKTIVDGKCYSIATIVFLSGDERLMAKSSELMIHLPWIDPSGQSLTSEDLQKMAEMMRGAEEKISNIYSERTSLSKSEVLELMKQERFMTADEAIKFGFATGLKEVAKAMAYFNNKKNNCIMNIEKIKNGLNLISEGIFGSEKESEQELSKPVALVIVDIDGKELTVEREDGDLMVGDKASPDGEYKLETGEVIVVKDGVIVEIKKVEEQKEEQSGDKKEPDVNIEEKINELAKNEKIIEELRAEIEQLKNKISEFENKKAVNATAKSSFVPGKRENYAANKPSPYDSFEKAFLKK